MGLPTSEVSYTPAMPRREDHEVHKDMWWHWTKKKIYRPAQVRLLPATRRTFTKVVNQNVAFVWEVFHCSDDDGESRLNGIWTGRTFKAAVSSVVMPRLQCFVLLAFLLLKEVKAHIQRSTLMVVKKGSSGIRKTIRYIFQIKSSDFSGYHSDFHEGHGTVMAW